MNNKTKSFLVYSTGNHLYDSYSLNPFHGETDLAFSKSIFISNTPLVFSSERSKGCFGAESLDLVYSYFLFLSS